MSRRPHDPASAAFFVGGASADEGVSVPEGGPREPRGRDAGLWRDGPAPRADSSCSGRRTRPWAGVANGSRAAGPTRAPRPPWAAPPGPRPGAQRTRASPPPQTERNSGNLANAVLESPIFPAKAAEPVCRLSAWCFPSSRPLRKPHSALLHEGHRGLPGAQEAGARRPDGRMDGWPDARAGWWPVGQVWKSGSAHPSARDPSRFGAPRHPPQTPSPCTHLGVNVTSERNSTM